MAQSADRPAPQSAWGFLGGYFLYFIGWAAGFIASIQFVEAREASNPAQQLQLGYVLVGLAVVLFAVGVQVLARSYFGGMSAHPEAIVLFLMTPLPAILAVFINLIGRYFRTSSGVILRLLLIGGGIYFIAEVAIALNDGFHRTASNKDLGAYLWPFALQGGVALVLLGLLPPGRSEPDPESLPEALPYDEPVRGGRDLRGRTSW